MLLRGLPANSGQRLIARHRLIEFSRRTIGLGRGVTQALGICHRLAEATQALICQRRRLGRIGTLTLDRLNLDFADRLFQRQPFACDVGFVERRLDTAQLVDQRTARPLVKRTAVLAGVFLEAGDGAGDKRLIISH